MSFQADIKESKEINIETLTEAVKWIKVVAYILADIKDIDAVELYEDLD